MMDITDALDRISKAIEGLGHDRSILTSALDVLQKDPHYWSKRSCATCQVITSLAGRDFGCVAYAKAALP